MFFQRIDVHRLLQRVTGRLILLARTSRVKTLTHGSSQIAGNERGLVVDVLLRHIQLPLFAHDEK